MARDIIDGVVQGLGLSEHSDPYGESGAVPLRYYVPTLHDFVTPETADNLSDLDFVTPETADNLSTFV